MENLNDICAFLDKAAINNGEIAAAICAELRAEKPLCLKAAEEILTATGQGARAFIITGFVLAPFNKPETDGPIGAVLLAKTLINLSMKPLLICPKLCCAALEAMLIAVGVSAPVIAFTDDMTAAEKEAGELIRRFKPKVVIATECPGRAASGAYHNAAGDDVTALQAKSDVLFDRCRREGIASVAIGDRGNECGLGALRGAVEKSVDKGEKIAAAVEADRVIIGRASDFGCYALCAALCAATGSSEGFFTQSEHNAVFQSARRGGLIDMGGESICAIDGIAISEVFEVSREMRRIITV